METRSYWEPSAPKGDVGRLGFGGCSGATPSFIFFHPPDLDHVNVAVGPAQDDQLVLLIGKIGASGMEQLFNHDEGPRLETWRHQPMHISAVAANIISISWGDGSKTTGLDIPVREQSIVLKDEAFRQGIPLNGVDSDWFDLDLPALSFDGSVLEFPRIRFTRVRRMLINPINC